MIVFAPYFSFFVKKKIVLFQFNINIDFFVLNQRKNNYFNYKLINR